MKPRNDPRAAGELGVVWHLVPTLWIVVAVAGAFVLSVWPALLADSMQPDNGAAASSIVMVPHANSDLLVPAASTVFKDHPWEVSQEIEQF